MKGITLIGMSGSGKSTVGMLIAKKTGRKFVDLDKLILHKEGKTHHEVMETIGEKGLTELEERYTLELDFSNIVLAPPGSLIYSPRAMDRVCAESQVVYLKTTPQIIEKRLGQKLHRNGIVGLKEKGLAKLMAERAVLYERYAEHTFETGQETSEEMASTIVRALSL